MREPAQIGQHELGQHEPAAGRTAPGTGSDGSDGSDGSARAQGGATRRFAPVEELWLDRFGNLRNTVRQELIARQLDMVAADSGNVLDVGCGQGTQLLRLAQRGWVATGADPSEELLGRLHDDAAATGVNVETHVADLQTVGQAVGDRVYDLVCAHGVLMYVDDPYAALATLTPRVRPGGLLSVTIRNAAAMAFRPAMRGQWEEALDGFDNDRYVNELGVEARADSLEPIAAYLDELGFRLETWYGVRVFTDPAPAEQPVPPNIATILEVEWQASSRDPYRRFASQLHLVARRTIVGGRF
jgi:S-adenosylmethionine-dependent methyltransferase